MCTVSIQAKHKKSFIKVPVKRTAMPCELVHSDVWGSFSTPTFGHNRYYIQFIDDYSRYTSRWLLPNQRAMTCASPSQTFPGQVDSMGHEIQGFQGYNGRGEYDNKTFQYVLAAHGSPYDPCGLFTHHKNGVAQCMICTITERAPAIMIDSQPPVQFWGETVNATVYLHQSSLNEVLKKNYCDGYQPPYETPCEMLHWIGEPTHDAICNKMS